MTTPIPPSLERFGDELDRAAHRELSIGPGRVRTRASFLRRPRMLAGSSLGLAGVGAAVLLALSGATSPAYAITQNSDGAVLVKINIGGRDTLLAADGKLIDQYHETVLMQWAPGPATDTAPIDCTPTADGAAPGDPMPPGPPVKLLMGEDNSFVIPSGNTGAGTDHVVSCQTYVSYPNSNTGSGNSGNTGS